MEIGDIVLFKKNVPFYYGIDNNIVDYLSKNEILLVITKVSCDNETVELDYYLPIKYKYCKDIEGYYVHKNMLSEFNINHYLKNHRPWQNLK